MNRPLTLSALTVAILASFNASADYTSLEDYQGKPATVHTQQANQTLAETLPWEDISAFERTRKGLIAEFGNHAAGELKNRFDYMTDMSVSDIPATVNPSIWRQGMLN